MSSRCVNCTCGAVGDPESKRKGIVLLLNDDGILTFLGVPCERVRAATEHLISIGQDMSHANRQRKKGDPRHPDQLEHLGWSGWREEMEDHSETGC